MSRWKLPDLIRTYSEGGTHDLPEVTRAPLFRASNSFWLCSHKDRIRWRVALIVNEQRHCPQGFLDTWSIVGSQSGIPLVSGQLLREKESTFRQELQNRHSEHNLNISRSSNLDAWKAYGRQNQQLLLAANTADHSLDAKNWNFRRTSIGRRKSTYTRIGRIRELSRPGFIPNQEEDLLRVIELLTAWSEQELREYVEKAMHQIGLLRFHAVLENSKGWPDDLCRYVSGFVYTTKFKSGTESLHFEEDWHYRQW